MAEKMIHVYFCGAHSTGKTSLQQELCKDDEFLKMGLKVQPEVARKWVVDNNYTQEFLQDNENLLRLNKELLQQQHLAEQRSETEATNIRGCLWDRGLIDPLGYIRHYIGKSAQEKCFDLPCVQEMLKRWRSSGLSIVILFPPVRKLVKDDKVRLNADWQDICKLHCAMESVLNEMGIKYHVLESIDIGERVKEVKTIIQKLEFA